MGELRGHLKGKERKSGRGEEWLFFSLFITPTYDFLFSILFHSNIIYLFITSHTFQTHQLFFQELWQNIILEDVYGTNVGLFLGGSLPKLVSLANFK